MDAGEVNFNTPYVKNENKAKGDNLIMERWNKLAGIQKK
jgi:hypothetical protein